MPNIKRHNAVIPFEEFADLMVCKFPEFTNAMNKRAVIHFGNGFVRISWFTKEGEPEIEPRKKSQESTSAKSPAPAADDAAQSVSDA